MLRVFDVHDICAKLHISLSELCAGVWNGIEGGKRRFRGPRLDVDAMALDEDLREPDAHGFPIPVHGRNDVSLMIPFDGQSMQRAFDEIIGTLLRRADEIMTEASMSRCVNAVKVAALSGGFGRNDYVQSRFRQHFYEQKIGLIVLNDW